MPGTGGTQGVRPGERPGHKEKGEGGSETEKLWENILYFRSARISRRFSLPVELLNQGISW